MGPDFSECIGTEGRFYHDGELGIDRVLLSDEEAAHALRARRLKQGSPIELFNGRGFSRKGTIERISRGQAAVLFTGGLVEHPASSRRLCLAVSPPKGDRMAFLVEKLSELGADLLIPTIFRRSIDAGARLETSRLDRWRRKAVEAAKQCGRYRLLEIEPPIELRDLLARAGGFEMKLLLDQGPKTPRAAAIFQEFQQGPSSSLLLVGPEGGLNREEKTRAEETGFTGAALNSNVLRVETAALAGCALFRSIWP